MSNTAKVLYVWLFAIAFNVASAEIPKVIAARKTIADPLVTTNQLVDALITLRNSQQTNEPSSFWTDIANSPKYNWDHRRRAVLQLFSRHFHSGMTLAEVGRFLNHATWLKPNSINVGAITSGQSPPHTKDSDEIAFVEIGPPQKNPQYLVFRTSHGDFGSHRKLYKCLIGEATDPDVKKLQIDEVLSCEFIKGVAVYNAWGIPPKTIKTQRIGDPPVIEE